MRSRASEDLAALAALLGRPVSLTAGSPAAAPAASTTHNTLKKKAADKLAARYAPTGIYTCAICNEANLHEVECGGGGNCLFLSASFLMRRLPMAPAAAIAPNLFHVALRAAVAALITQWSQPLFVWNQPLYPLIAKPTPAEAAYIAPLGRWGGDLETLAIVSLYPAITIHVIDIVNGQHLSYGNGATILHVLFPGGHYRALAPQALVNAAGAIPGPMRYWEMRAAARSRAQKESKTRVSQKGRVLKNKADDLPFWNLFLPESASKSSGASSAKPATSSGGSGSAAVAAAASPSSSASSVSESDFSGEVDCVEIHHIDVGQGDATLVLLKDRAGLTQRTILIDTGRTGNEVINYLGALNESGDFRPIDVFCISHYDSDHIGGAVRILTGGPSSASGRASSKVRWVQHDVQIFDLGEPRGSEDSDYTNYVEALESAPPGHTRINYPLHTPLLELGAFSLSCKMFNGWTLGEKTIYSEFAEAELDQQELAADNVIHAQNKNECSAALLLSFNSFNYFTAGDLLGRFETRAALVAAGSVEADHICVMKHGHHGATEASQPSVLRALRPRLGMISCGRSSQFGHPSPALVQRLDQFANDLIAAQPAAGGIRFQYRVSADTAAADGARPHGRVGAAGVSAVGTSVVRVTTAQSLAHSFRVRDAAVNADYHCLAGRGALALPNRADEKVILGAVDAAEAPPDSSSERKDRGSGPGRSKRVKASAAPSAASPSAAAAAAAALPSAAAARPKKTNGRNARMLEAMDTVRGELREALDRTMNGDLRTHEAIAAELDRSATALVRAYAMATLHPSPLGPTEKHYDDEARKIAKRLNKKRDPSAKK